MALTEPLDAVEERVLGVLVEKGFTTPEGYPLSLNALVSGCNQKSNRHPSASYTEQTVHEALLRLRMHRIVREVHTAGARVPKFAHAARDVLEVDDQELAILAELLLRGDQTHGELRGRVKRMSPVDSLAALAVLLSKLEDRAMVRSLPPLPGSRAGRVGHLLGIKGDGEGICVHLGSFSACRNARSASNASIGLMRSSSSSRSCWTAGCSTYCVNKFIWSSWAGAAAGTSSVE